MSNNAIEVNKLGKMYKLYKNTADKVFDVFGLNFWKKNYFQEFWALRDLDLTVKKGERIGIIGRNGAGKSTLLKIIIGNIMPTEGTISVNGRIQALMELGTGFHPEFTGRENIRASLAYQGFTTRQIAEKEDEIIDFAELDNFIDQPIKTYSAGMYARLAFSTATAIEPDILIIDEVLGAGDAYFAGKCVERMRKLTDESGATVLFVSHDLNSVLQLCDRVIWIDRGKVGSQGDPLQVIKEYTAMVRKQEEIRLRARDLKVNKKNAIFLDSKEDIYSSLLCRFVGEGGITPKGDNKIYGIRVLADNEEIGYVDVGGPMDNSENENSFVLDAKGYMDWGRPEKDKLGMFRRFTDMKGIYKHAPFQFMIPKDDVDKAYTIEIDADVENNIELEMHCESRYVPLGMLAPKGYYRYSFSIPSLGRNEESIIVQNVETDKKSKNHQISEQQDELISEENIFDYGSREVRIKAVKMLNNVGKESKVLEVEEPMKVLIEYESNIELIEPVFVLCIYMPDGKCASQWIAGSESYNSKKIPRKGNFVFEIDKLLLGQGSYVVSVGIFKHLAKGNYEAESYHVLDRSIHFKIVQSINSGLDKGICVQPFRCKVE